MKISTWLKDSTIQLSSIGITTPRLDTELLLEYGLRKTREYILAHDDEELSKTTELHLNTLLQKRMQHIPVAYITCTKEFYNRTFHVTEAVLIPRPESESIISVLSRLYNASADLSILDVGTGSGVLGITAKLEFPNTQVVASDLSESSLSVAKKNAHLLNADVEFCKADLLKLPYSFKPTVIVANLPYVPDGMVTSQEIASEPPTALFSGIDGLDHYHKFWDQLSSSDMDPLHIIVESLTSQHDSMISFADSANYKLVETDILVQHFTKR